MSGESAELKQQKVKMVTNKLAALLREKLLLQRRQKFGAQKNFKEEGFTPVTKKAR